ncbi:hypothetical protein T484DRAFT_1989599 [Baffinella frigidus]|nr:hypothetical protein T484DRAFT_1989599 [Cryptophyta sp. CCMP2293]
MQAPPPPRPRPSPCRPHEGWPRKACSLMVRGSERRGVSRPRMKRPPRGLTPPSPSAPSFQSESDSCRIPPPRQNTQHQTLNSMYAGGAPPRSR